MLVDYQSDSDDSELSETTKSEKTTQNAKGEVQQPQAMKKKPESLSAAPCAKKAKFELPKFSKGSMLNTTSLGLRSTITSKPIPIQESQPVPPPPSLHGETKGNVIVHSRLVPPQVWKNKMNKTTEDV